MIVSTLLIILLVLVALGIIWGVVRNVLNEGAEEVELGKFLISLQLKRAYINDGNLGVNVKRGIGEGELSGMTFVFSDGQNSEVIAIEESLNELESGTYTFSEADLESLSINDITSVSVAPIYSSGSGAGSIGEITGSAEISDAPENIPSPSVCGNDLVESGEICDRSALGSQTCLNFGHILGELACLSDCSGYDLSDCSGGVCVNEDTQACPLLEGVCAGSEQICIEEAWPGCTEIYSLIEGYNEFGETGALCSDGLDNDCDGLTDNEESTCELTWIGTVGSPWPLETKLLFDIVEINSYFITPSVIYEGKYIGFNSPSAESRCIQIYDYITPFESELYNKAIVRLDGEVDLPINIVAGDTFTIYETSECGVFN